MAAMRIADGENWAARRASLALALAVIAVAAMPALAGFGSELVALLRDLAARMPTGF